MKTKKTQNSWLKKAFKWLTITGLCGAGAAVSLGLVVFSVVYYQLPPIDALTQYRPKVPLRIYTADGDLIGEFGEERRDYVPFEEIPRHVKLAFLPLKMMVFMSTPALNSWGLRAQRLPTSSQVVADKAAVRSQCRWPVISF